ncbi:putative permease family protein [Paratrimastix pyriformis]|uniref:Permease family protein n=1 Tax=Paratrimastix pyriformis TaxID=342808 RepID=A0ABQ8U319_9EUKA|nr:putative permease family protein [Paratrimastix pyriformis]
MPLISNIFPIRRALSNTLRDSLDLYHQTFAGTRVTFTHLERLGLSPVQTAVAILLVVVGFMMYYIAPSAFVYGNISLFLSIMNDLLIGLVIGLAIISTIFQPYLEQLMLHLIMWGSDRPLKKLVRKSLAGHRSRNRKTALMFTISLAFIIFAGAMFALQASMISDNVQMGLGSDIVITAPSFNDPLAEDDMRAWLEAELALGKASRITGYTPSPPSRSDRTGSSPPPGSPTWPPRMPRLIDHRPPVFHGPRQTVTGVESHFRYDTFNQFYFPGEVYGGLAYNHSSNGSPDVFQSDSSARRCLREFPAL